MSFERVRKSLRTALAIARLAGLAGWRADPQIVSPDAEQVAVLEEGPRHWLLIHETRSVQVGMQNDARAVLPNKSVFGLDAFLLRERQVAVW